MTPLPRRATSSGLRARGFFVEAAWGASVAPSHVERADAGTRSRWGCGTPTRVSSPTASHAEKGVAVEPPVGDGVVSLSCLGRAGSGSRLGLVLPIVGRQGGERPCRHAWVSSPTASAEGPEKPAGDGEDMAIQSSCFGRAGSGSRLGLMLPIPVRRTKRSVELEPRPPKELDETLCREAPAAGNPRTAVVKFADLPSVMEITPYSQMSWASTPPLMSPMDGSPASETSASSDEDFGELDVAESLEDARGMDSGCCREGPRSGDCTTRAPRAQAAPQGFGFA